MSTATPDWCVVFRCEAHQREDFSSHPDPANRLKQCDARFQVFAQCLDVMTERKRSFQVYSKVIGTVQNGSKLLLLQTALVSKSGVILEVWSCRGLRHPPGSSNCSKYAIMLNHQRKHTSYLRRMVDLKCRCYIYKRGAKTDPYGTPFFRRRSLLLFAATCG